MITLLVIGHYRAAGVTYEPGRVLTVSEDEARRLLADSPSSFHVQERAPVAVAAPEAPPADKMVRAPGRRKAGAE